MTTEKLCVITGNISTAVSLRNLAGSSPGLVALFVFISCLTNPSVPISRMGLSQLMDGASWGMG